MRSRLYERELDQARLEKVSDAGLMNLIRSPYGEPSGRAQEIQKSLGFSSAFLSFITYVRQHGDLTSTAIVNIPPAVQTNLRDKACKLGDGEKFHWTREVLGAVPGILEAANLDADAAVLNGWHAVWTNSNKTYNAIGAIIEGHKPLQIEQQQKLLTRFGNDPVATNPRYDSQAFEDFSGFRPGRFSFWLGDDVLDSFETVNLHKSYAEEPLHSDSLVFFTVHTGFFFVCRQTDLQTWLKSEEGRAAFCNENGDRLRIEGFQFPATARDLQTLSTLAGKPLNDLLPELRAQIPKQVPTENIPKALATKIESHLRTNFPSSTQRHLSWRTDEVITEINKSLHLEDGQ